ncbi:MAG: hypothetical protein IPL74_08880 [Bacteroidetes bacterium]|nr:hypothetical protein [Bacteroidota bacterium]
MKKILYLIVCLVVIQTKLYAAFATLEYNLPPPLGGYSAANFNVCGSKLKNFKVYYQYCSVTPGCAPANLCIGNGNYRFIVTLYRNGSSVASHTFQASGSWTYDYFNGITVTPGTYNVGVVFQRSNLLCSWVTLGTEYSNSIIVSTLPPAPVISISGNATPCNTTSTTFTVNGNNTGSGTYTWTSSNSNFLINGVSFPLTTTSNSAVINATVPGSTSTISVTLNGVTTPYCGTINVPTRGINAVSTSLSVYGPDCIPPGTSGNLVANPAGSSGYTGRKALTWLTGVLISLKRTAISVYFFRLSALTIQECSVIYTGVFRIGLTILLLYYI